MILQCGINIAYVLFYLINMTLDSSPYKKSYVSLETLVLAVNKMHVRRSTQKP